MSNVREFAVNSKSWPFQEAVKLMEYIGDNVPGKGYVLFETGYGPSGLPHIGTFGEVARTSMVRRAFQEISDIPTRLFAFSDDMDGLRKVPENIPEKEMVAQFIGKPLTSVPDPFGTHSSFGAHNNSRLCAFLDDFGFDYDFVSSTECYKKGLFDEALLSILQHYEKILEVILPTLGPERRATYSPFLPVCPSSGKVLQVPIIERNLASGTIVYESEGEFKTEVPVTGGHCKLQWKADWAMRWHALGVDYEMSGKDLIDSVHLSSKICQILGGTPPQGFTYELFLDENGEKISKSRGNGLTIEEWLKYAAPESLSLYMLQSPRKAKRLYFDVIPKTCDEYISHLAKFTGQGTEGKLSNPVWHIHAGLPPTEVLPINFGLLMNLVAACNTENPDVLWGFITRYAPEVNRAESPILERFVGYAVAYYIDFVKPLKKYRLPDEKEVLAMQELILVLEDMDFGVDPEDIQNAVYEIGNKYEFESLRDWFRALYEVCFGQSQGPRIGSFIALYGLSESVTLIRNAIDGGLVNGYSQSLD